VKSIAHAKLAQVNFWMVLFASANSQSFLFWFFLYLFFFLFS
jgi:hypothetical protein